MAQGDVMITVVGNIVADPELRYTPQGVAVANFRVASTSRRYDSQTGQWVDGDATFLTCNLWRQAAENAAESLKKGMRVLVYGKLRQRSYETREGEKRTVFEVEAEEVGPSLRYATADVQRNPRDDSQGYSGGGGQQSGYQQGGQSGGGQRNARSSYGQGSYDSGNGNDPWSDAPPAGGFGQQDAPPF